MPVMAGEYMQWRYLDSRHAAFAARRLGRGSGFPFRPFDQRHRAIFVAKLLRVLGFVSFHRFIEVIVKRANCNTPGARVDSLPLQRVEQMRHQNAVPLLHLRPRYLATPLRCEHDAPFIARQIAERLAEKQRGIFGGMRMFPRASRVRDIQNGQDIASF